ncbi:uncharacterized protein [Arachis hypogaea]|uniref:uncharacterized protein n=1 Tax=Arachis hypogaea TaxID=3818 RepID=UPI0034E77C85|nr:uncharacterized protein DS421_5g164550 [Arachis hypogaea]
MEDLLPRCCRDRRTAVSEELVPRSSESSSFACAATFPVSLSWSCKEHHRRSRTVVSPSGKPKRKRGRRDCAATVVARELHSAVGVAIELLYFTVDELWYSLFVELVVLMRESLPEEEKTVSS